MLYATLSYGAGMVDTGQGLRNTFWCGCADKEFVQKFTPPDFQAKIFTMSIAPNFNSFSGKKTQKMSENGEIYTLAKILHYRRQ